MTVTWKSGVPRERAGFGEFNGADRPPDLVRCSVEFPDNGGLSQRNLAFVPRDSKDPLRRVSPSHNWAHNGAVNSRFASACEPAAVHYRPGRGCVIATTRDRAWIAHGSGCD